MEKEKSIPGHTDKRSVKFVFFSKKFEKTYSFFGSTVIQSL